MRVLVCLLPMLVTGCASINPWKSPADDPDAFEQTQYDLRDDEAEGVFGGVVKTSLKEQVRKAVGKGPDKDAARQLYQEAEQLYRQAAALKGGERAKTFLAAAERYTEAALRWPDSSLEEDATFMAADSQFFADHYFDANEKFEELLKKYPNSKHLDRAEARRFAIARYWEQLDSESEDEPLYYMNFLDESRPFRNASAAALRIYDKIRIDDPTGRLADDATMAAANLHFEHGKYVLADEYYTDLRRTFPNSEHLFMAHFLGLRAKLASYQGTDYSGTVLRQGEKLIETMRTQFPRESRQHDEYLGRASAEVKFLLAEREWADAQYYDRRDEFGAARFHYARLLREFPRTPFAEKAAARAESIEGLPDIPPQKAEWLVNLFPREAEPTVKAMPELQQQSPEAIARSPQDYPAEAR